MPGGASLGIIRGSHPFQLEYRDRANSQISGVPGKKAGNYNFRTELPSLHIDAVIDLAMSSRNLCWSLHW